MVVERRKSFKASVDRMFDAAAAPLDLVRSDLDDTLRGAYSQIREVYLGRERVLDLRTAAYVVAIEKVAQSYKEMLY